MKLNKSIIWLTLLMVTIAFTTATAEKRIEGPIIVETITTGPQYLTIPSSKLEKTTSSDLGDRSGSDKPATVAKQGGEDVDNATPIIGLPFSSTGTTVGYANDYESISGGCTQTNAPDVVYSYFSTANQRVNIITCNPGTDYWTKIFVFENDASNTIACNQYSDNCLDEYGVYRGDLYAIQLYAGETYYIVIDGGIGGPSGNYELSIEALPPWIPFGQHPALDEGEWGTMALAYEDTGSSGGLTSWFGGSIDEGNSWTDFSGWLLPGGAYFPSVDYWGNDSVFYGTMVPSDSFASGAAVMLVDLINVDNAGMVYWAWDTVGDPERHFWGMTMNDIACHDSQDDWMWGVISTIFSTDWYGTSDIRNDIPILTWQTTVAGGGTMYWYPTVEGCSTTTCDIDPVMDKTYAVYDRLDTDGRWKMFISQDNYLDLFNPSNGSYSMVDNSHIQFPVVSAYGNNVVIVMENWSNADPNQKDVVCFSSVTGNVSSLSYNTVVNDNQAERFPQVEHISGSSFLCAFIKNNAVYATLTTDAGSIWSSAVQISEPGDSVVTDYRAFSMTESDGYYIKIIYSYYDTEKAAGDVALRIVEYEVFTPPDTDGDSIPDPKDNCPGEANSDQMDSDFDGLGDVCDNCPYVKNRYQENGDGDSHGDVCDNCPSVDNEDQENKDNDTFGDDCDNCPDDDNENQLNSDLDTHGDACDNCIDDDNENQLNSDLDTYGDVCDNCPDSTNQDQLNSDNDSHGDVCDNCPVDDNEDQADSDSDGIGDVCDGVCGDFNGDELVNIFDVTGLIDFLYLDGDPPVDLNNVDVNSDLTVNIFDITYLIDFLYLGGPEPNCP